MYNKKVLNDLQAFFDAVPKYNDQEKNEAGIKITCKDGSQLTGAEITINKNVLTVDNNRRVNTSNVLKITAY